MSDEENSALNSRFNKFENSSRKFGNNSLPLKNNVTLKRSHSRESFSYDAKKPCSQFPETSNQLNRTWAGNTSSISPGNNTTKYSANNRLKKLRDNLDNSIQNASSSKVGESVNNTVLQKTQNISVNSTSPFHVNKTSRVNNSAESISPFSEEKAADVNEIANGAQPFSVIETAGVNNIATSTHTLAKTLSVQHYNIDNKKSPEFPKTNEASTSFSVSSKEECNVNKPLICTPVNIYKNLDKWAPGTSVNKSSKRGLANERLQRLKKHVNNSDKDNIHSKSQVSENADQNSHVSPLLRGLKRSHSDIVSECSTPKKIALDKNSNQFTPQSRTMKLVQSAISNENTNNNSGGDKDVFVTPTALKKSVSGRLKILNNILLASPSQNVDDTQSNKKESMSSTNCRSEKKPTTPKVFEDDDYSQKMQMTANWVNSHHLVGSTQSNPISDGPEVGKCSTQFNPFSTESRVKKTSTIKTEQNLNETQYEVEDMEWANAEPDDEPSKVPSANKPFKTPSADEHSNMRFEDEPSKMHLEDEPSKIHLEDEPTKIHLEDEPSKIQSDAGSSKTHEETKQDVKDNDTVADVQKDPEKLTNLCIVVDTNIFIKNLNKIKDILNMKIKGPLQPILYIPWMVITELDYIKDSSCLNEKLKKDVMNSVKFINTTLSEKNERVVAQTVYDMQHQEQLGTSADDKIMSCCLLVKKKYESVILLSNDLNLKNKAMIHGIEVCSANEIVMKIMSKLTRNVKYQKIHHKMSILCSTIICDCAKDTFGDAWKKMDMFASPPWSLTECLKRFRKYWNTVFKDKLLKHFTMPLDEFLVWLKTHKYISDDSKEYVKFVEYCITLCIHLRDIQECRGAVQNTLKEITKLG